jgi:hypothetical protein
MVIVKRIMNTGGAACKSCQLQKRAKTGEYNDSWIDCLERRGESDLPAAG